MPRRDNGLQASRYVALLDLEPQLADAMLEALREQSVAAYATAAPGVTGAYLDVHLPDRPKDRLWVDADAVARARALVHAQLPALQEQYAAEPAADPLVPRESDEDALWQAIVAGYEATERDPVRRWPATEDVPEPSDEPSSGPADGPRRGHSRLVRQAQPVEPVEPVGPVGPVEPVGPGRPPGSDDHYIPPPPPPLPTTDAVTKLAWTGLVGGPGYLLLAAITGRGLSERTAVLAVIAFVVGFVTLVARMKDRPPRDSGPDDGAVV